VEGFFDLSGRVSLSVEEAGGAEQAIRRQMDPFAPTARAPREADVVLAPTSERRGRSIVDVQNPANDDLVTASDGTHLLLRLHGRWCEVPDPTREGPAAFTYDPGFPVARAFRTLVRPALQIKLACRAAVAVHAASVEVDGRGVLVAGWSESGKTETALALMEDGARFLSDKWTVVGADGGASAFPIGVGVRRWVLPYLPRLAASLPGRARVQMGAAGVVAAMAEPVRRRTGGARGTGRPAEYAGRVVALADRVALTPGQLREAYGQHDDPARRVPLGVVVLLTTVAVADVTAREADPAWAAARLARTAAYERRAFFHLLERRAYVSPLHDARPGPAERVLAADQALLGSVLSGVRVIEVRAPFPVDPRRVVAAMQPWLSP
jgi:hypothetical protein